MGYTGLYFIKQQDCSRQRRSEQLEYSGDAMDG
jgi:hypothetical protein